MIWSQLHLHAAELTLHHVLHTPCKTNGVGFTAQYQPNDLCCMLLYRLHHVLHMPCKTNGVGFTAQYQPNDLCCMLLYRLHHVLHMPCKTNGVGFTAQYQTNDLCCILLYSSVFLVLMNGCNQWQHNNINNDLITVAFAAELTLATPRFAHAMQDKWGRVYSTISTMICVAYSYTVVYSWF